MTISYTIWYFTIFLLDEIFVYMFTAYLFVHFELYLLARKVTFQVDGKMQQNAMSTPHSEIVMRLT